MYTLKEECIRAVLSALSRFGVKMFLASFILSTCSPLAAVRSSEKFHSSLLILWVKSFVSTKQL